ncbi:RHS repeat-associated core domain-containing protein, partial [Flavobacterium amniphilum]|uniref:RHS repeat domain-containing protein n=1 Tax=Flavobacterium amniphilum TaxID=1834035 RepID=UPI00202A98CF
YNHLNLPVNITFYNPHGKQTKIEYIYDAVGSKKAKKVHYYEPDYSGGGGSEMKGATASNNAAPVNSSVGPTTYLQKMTQTDYMAGGFQYKDEVIEFIPHAEGFVKSEKGSYVYYFNYTDHLGNVRVTYTDDGSGTPYVVEESNYYPFGLKHKGYNEPDQNPMNWGNIVTSGSYLNHKYKYNGKEFQDELGLNMYDYGARLYDSARAGWMNIDPLAEKMRRFSPYNYCFNNPLRFTDPDGMAPIDSTDPPGKKKTAKERAYNPKTYNTDLVKWLVYGTADFLSSINSYVREKIAPSDKEITTTSTSKKGGGENEKSTGKKVGGNIDADPFLDGAPGSAKKGNNFEKAKDIMDAAADAGSLSDKIDKAEKKVKEAVKENSGKGDKSSDMVQTVNDPKNPNNNVYVRRDLLEAQQKKK